MRSQPDVKGRSTSLRLFTSFSFGLIRPGIFGFCGVALTRSLVSETCSYGKNDSTCGLCIWETVYQRAAIIILGLGSLSDESIAWETRVDELVSRCLGWLTSLERESMKQRPWSRGLDTESLTQRPGVARQENQLVIEKGTNALYSAPEILYIQNPRTEDLTVQPFL